MLISTHKLFQLFLNGTLQEVQLAKMTSSNVLNYYWSNKGKNLIFQTKLTKNLLKQYIVEKRETIEILLTPTQLQALKKLSPHLLFQTQFKTSIPLAIEEIEKLNTINKLSYKKRTLVYTKDIVRKYTSNGVPILETSHGVPLEKKYLSSLLKQKNPRSLIEYGYPEKGVLVFLEKESRNFKIHSRLMDRLNTLAFPIYQAHDETAFLAIKKKLSPHLFLFSYSPNSLQSKILHLKLKIIDPLAKVFWLQQSEFELTATFLKNLSELYQSPYQLEEKKNPQKELLSLNIQNKILKEINLLKQSYRIDKHAELVFFYEKLKKNYNVLLFKKLLKNIEEPFAAHFKKNTT